MDYVSEKTQQVNFVSQALPDLFHATPDQFLFLLNRDGTRFLRFYWDEVGKTLDSSCLEQPFGLNYDIRQPNPRTWVALVTLPTPVSQGESYFVALVYRPDRVGTFLRVADTTRVVVLEHWLEDDRPVTRLAEWTRRHGREEIGPGPAVSLEGFYQAVLHLL